MTHIQNNNENELEELLIKNLPATIKAGNEKKYSNIYEMKTKVAIHKFKFINFNSKDRISFMIFDIDEYNGKEAKEHFKDIDGLLDFITDKIGYEPTYILETNKGFHFAYHLKNHIFTHQPKALKYLTDIKRRIIELLHCDEIASNRNSGVFRNPLLHTHYYSYQVNYELNDFKDLIPKVTSNHRIRKNGINTSDDEIIEGKRNKTLFKFGMRYAKAQEYTTSDDIYDFINNLNLDSDLPLESAEVYSIAKSIYKYWTKNEIRYGIIQKDKDINEGAMNFPKMKNLTKEEYVEETKRRQKLASQYAVEKRDKEKNKEQLKKARAEFLEQKNIENEKIVLDALEYFKSNDMKINVSRIAQYCGFDRRFVKKYLT